MVLRSYSVPRRGCTSVSLCIENFLGRVWYMAHFSWYSVASNFQRTNNLVLLYYVFKLLKCRMQNCEDFEEFFLRTLYFVAQSTLYVAQSSKIIVTAK